MNATATAPIEGKVERTRAVARRTPQPVASRAMTTPADLLALALDKGADLDRLERLMVMQREWEADQARKAYVDDMARFKSAPITIEKDRHVNYTKSNNSVVDYNHASIGNVTSTVCAALAACGFSHRWNTEQKDGGIVVSCVITHRLGHSESTTLRANADDSGGKNSIQAIASTVTYLQRYTLLAATGLATSDGDDDGRSAGDTQEGASDGRDPHPDNSPTARLIADLYSVADEGVAALTRAWADLTERDRRMVGKEFGKIKKKAEDVDKRPQA